MSTSDATNTQTERSNISNNAELRSLVQLANEGDVAARAQLREVLDASPEIWRKVGDLAAHSRLTLIRMIANGDQLLLESVQRNADEMEAELLGMNPSRLERMLVADVISCWLHLQFADTVSTSSNETVGQTKFWAQERDRAHRRHLSSVKALVQTRQLLSSHSEIREPETDCNKNGEQTFDGSATQRNGQSHAEAANDNNGVSTLPDREPRNGNPRPIRSTDRSGRHRFSSSFAEPNAKHECAADNGD